MRAPRALELVCAIDSGRAYTVLPHLAQTSSKGIADGAAMPRFERAAK